MATKKKVVKKSTKEKELKKVDIPASCWAPIRMFVKRINAAQNDLALYVGAIANAKYPNIKDWKLSNDLKQLIVMEEHENEG